jgi:hypothetical protein
MLVTAWWLLRDTAAIFAANVPLQAGSKYVKTAGAMGLLKNLFSKEDRFLHLLEASAEEGRASVQALQKILKAPSAPGALEEILQSRDKERQIRTEIDVLLCKGTPTPLAREDVEEIGRASCRERVSLHV